MFGPLSRRRFVKAGGITGLGALARAGVAAVPAGTFPRSFLWGAGTAAHQVEGNNVNNDLWLIEGLPEAGFAEPSGDAIDQYHRFANDIALLAKLGLNTYRFSVEWARIEPREGAFSVAELDHYRTVLRVCRAAGLKTVVTLHHFTSPLWLARRGGFTNLASVALFARYAARVVEHCGDLIDYVSTFNEANMSFTSYVPPAVVGRMLDAARKASGSADFSCFLFDDVAVSKPIVRAAHAAARTAIKAKRPALPVGLTLAMDDVQDAPDAPGLGKAERSHRYDVWLEAVRGDDYLGVQNYTRVRIGAKGPIALPAGVPVTQLHQEVYPPSLGNVVRYAASVVRVPIIVTEHGIGTEDDGLRGRFIRESLAGLRACIADGIDVRGYCHWSAFDNYEWSFGYGPKFGLIAVDRTTQKRTPKPSAMLYGSIARSGTI